jgi:hypothetical protein
MDTMKQLIALGTLLFTFNVAASCPSAVPARTPEIPDGAATSEQSMVVAMTAVRTYVQTIEAYLDCRDFALSDRRYDELVDKASDAAGAYNRELVRFQQRDEALARN